MVKAYEMAELSAKVKKESEQRGLQEAIKFLDKFISSEIEQAANRGAYGVIITSESIQSPTQLELAYYYNVFTDCEVEQELLNLLVTSGFVVTLSKKDKQIRITW